MFQSYKYLGYYNYDEMTNEYSWRYKIVDTEFEEDEFAVAGGVGVGNGVVVAVIDIYSKRGLPVAPNLFIALQWYSSKYSYSLEQVIAWQKQYNPRYKDYEQDIDKLLILL